MAGDERPSMLDTWHFCPVANGCGSCEMVLYVRALESEKAALEARLKKEETQAENFRISWLREEGRGATDRARGDKAEADLAAALKRIDEGTVDSRRSCRVAICSCPCHLSFPIKRAAGREGPPCVHCEHLHEDGKCC